MLLHENIESNKYQSYFWLIFIISLSLYFISLCALHVSESGEYI